MISIRARAWHGLFHLLGTVKSETICPSSVFCSKIGKWLPIMSRVVTRTVLGHGLDARGEDLAHWNVVQNNGMSFMTGEWPIPCLCLSYTAEAGFKLYCRM